MLAKDSKASALFIAAVVVILLSQLFVAGYLLNIFTTVEDAQQKSVTDNKSIAIQTSFLSKLHLIFGYKGYIPKDANLILQSYPDSLIKLRQNFAQLLVLRPTIVAIDSDEEAIRAIDDIYQTIELYVEKIDQIVEHGNNLDMDMINGLIAIDDGSALVAMRLLGDKLTDKQLQHRNLVDDFLQQSNRDLQYGLFVVGLLLLQTLVLLFSFYKLTRQNKKMDLSLRYLNAFINESPEAMMVINIEGDIIRVNHAFTQLTGYTDAELLQLPVERLLAQEFHAGFEAFRHSLKAKWEGPKVERQRSIKVKKKDGSDIDVEYSVSRVQNSPYVILNIRDVTLQKLAEKSALRAQRMDAIGQLTAGVAHDFNNILAAIMGNTECAELFIADKAQAEHHLNLVKKAVEKASSLTSQLLAYSRKQPLQQRRLVISDVISDMADILRSILGRKIELSIVIEEASWSVEIDKVQLETAIINLCLNAKQAMDEGGKLSIVVQNITLDDVANKEIEGSTQDYVSISINDTGHGIPDAIKSRVTEPFFTTKIKGQASGLGLSMVFGFIKQSQGNLQIHSEEGQGTSVKLFIPRARIIEPAEGPELMTSQQGGAGNHGDIILVIEDDDEVRKLPTLILSQQGYRVLEAASPQEALAIAENEPQIDLIFSDVILSSDINGIELAVLLLKLHSAAKLIFTTGYMDELMLQDNNLPHDTPILKKPYSRAQLLQLVSEKLGGGEDIKA
jgi:PAS domain S-box-containing protein